jgi:hypothetical protein
MKKHRDKMRTNNMRRNQETGIVNSDALSLDLQARKLNIRNLKEEYKTLQEKLLKMQAVINRANDVKDQIEAPNN